MLKMSKSYLFFGDRLFIQSVTCYWQVKNRNWNGERSE